MELAQIWRHPVKSMIGESLPEAELSSAGLVGDRGWAVRDEVRGGIRGAKKLGGLMRLAASYPNGPGGPVDVRLTDGSTVRSDAPDVDARLSEALDHAVTLWPLRPAEDLAHYRRGAPDSDDLLEELRGIFGRLEDEPLPDLSVFPPEIIEYESPPGTYVDAYPLLVMTTTALRSLGEALPESNIDVRRFRPNLLIDSGDLSGHPELDWAGRRLRVGEVELELVTPCPRCVMVTREVDADVSEDTVILRHIVAELDQNVGVYARVTDPGSVHVGDEAELL